MGDLKLFIPMVIKTYSGMLSRKFRLTMMLFNSIRASLA
ncbi:hypothetical protein SAMN06296036_10929 [Pseudobacteriovorax antillogorgiicola]|uniref:Uncharacterized protein n=1 Tax=Pseudobacteriovorax antillogorgiicola TaxID=1513793 RepID=A0A1Y6BTW1_9BACT|nr:hypothetical protein EDD56_109184 [Pseudobacteriovorax antillogorgiicola]SMF28665.1 hypothetical protein SAMN06296036_10929 [Pseudobacteriovorax antillogorgiicola]